MLMRLTLGSDSCYTGQSRAAATQGPCCVLREREACCCCVVAAAGLCLLHPFWALLSVAWSCATPTAVAELGQEEEEDVVACV